MEKLATNRGKVKISYQGYLYNKSAIWQMDTIRMSAKENKNRKGAEGELKLKMMK